MPKRTYRTGSPGFFERIFGGAPEAYAYSRFTKEPITFHEGPVNWRGDYGQHSDFPLVGGIDVDVTRDDPERTLQHETMHHAFPWYMDKDDQHGLMAPLESDDPQVQKTGLSLIEPEAADVSLLERLLRRKNGL